MTANGGEAALWRAVMQQAVRDLKGAGLSDAPPGARARIRVEARRWLDERDFGTVARLAGAEDVPGLRRRLVALARPSREPVDLDWRYRGLDPATVDEVFATRLDRTMYLDLLRSLPPGEALARARSDLDADRNLTEATRGDT